MDFIYVIKQYNPLIKMITSGPEFDKFVVEPGMEIEPFDIKLAKEIFLNHPFKIILLSLRKHLPYGSYFSDEVDICDLYFKLLDDYNRYGIAFKREHKLFPDNILYVIENDNSKKYEYHSHSKYKLLSQGKYDKKTLLFNKVKKIDFKKYDRGEKPLSEWEKEKRKCIKEQKNKYLQIAMMDPDVYNNDKLFEYLIIRSSDYNGDFVYCSSLMFSKEKSDEYFKKTYKKQIDMVKRIDYLINEGNSEYLGIID